MKNTEELKRAKQASRILAHLNKEKINTVLLDIADEIGSQSENILEANKRDCVRIEQNDPKYDRLLLTSERLVSIAEDMRNVARLPFPVGDVVEERTLDNGLVLKKVSVPIGVIGIIFEARPNVTFDVFALCFKSGNACVLKGGSDAKDSNTIIVALIHAVLLKHDIDPAVLTLLSAEREAVQTLLDAVGVVDVIIPRGSQGLIDFVRTNTNVPVIETGAGIVHTYIDGGADTAVAGNIVFNAKTRRPSVCNALDTILVHESELTNLLSIVEKLAESRVEIFADNKSFDVLEKMYPKNLLFEAKENHFGTEFLSLKLSIKTVSSLDEALVHIAKYSSQHSEAIISQNQEHIDTFLAKVDAAAVYANASTTFTDGGEFGLGAEIGISTQKLHARGPMGLKELTTYKWIVVGNGQVRA
jgi:glutamate-5-semialdehyde dehydrogenase